MAGLFKRWELKREFTVLYFNHKDLILTHLLFHDQALEIFETPYLGHFGLLEMHSVLP